MATAENGNTVKVHYTGKLDDGTVFDSSKDREPIQFTIGANQVIPGFENGIIGMQTGESKDINIHHTDAYGSYRDDLCFDISRDEFPNDEQLSVGQQFQMQNDKGDVIIVEIKELKDDSVILDANHRLAGKDLTFEVELVEIV